MNGGDERPNLHFGDTSPDGLLAETFRIVDQDVDATVTPAVVEAKLRSFMAHVADETAQEYVAAEKLEPARLVAVAHGHTSKSVASVRSSEAAADELVAYLGADIAGRLREWSLVNGFRVDVPAQPWRASDGYSGASLRTVIVGKGHHSQQLILKVFPLVLSQPSDPESQPEPARLEAARRDNPGFAADHLVTQPHDAQLTSGNQVLMFQSMAGGGDDCRSLADWPKEDLPAACAYVVAELIRSWNRGKIDSDKGTVSGFLAETTGRALTAKGTIRRWAEPVALLDREVSWISLPDSPDTFPNPVGMALGTAAIGTEQIDVLRGLSHTDLHLLNVLIPGGSDITDFQLIDLAGYSPRGLLTHDPVCLMLSGVAATVEELEPGQQDELIALIVSRGRSPRAEVPFRIVAAIREAFGAAVVDADVGWGRTWPLQFLLSIQAMALVFTSFERFTPQVRWWFFRLSAHAALEALHVLDPNHYIPPGKSINNPFAAEQAAQRDARPVQPELDDLPDVLSRLMSEHDRIDLLGQQDLAAAADQMEVLCRQSESALGPDHPFSIRSQFNRARRLEESGRIGAAVRLYEATLATAMRVLGAGHETTKACKKAVWARDLRRRMEEEQE